MEHLLYSLTVRATLVLAGVFRNSATKNLITAVGMTGVENFETELRMFEHRLFCTSYRWGGECFSRKRLWLNTGNQISNKMNVFDE